MKKLKIHRVWTFSKTSGLKNRLTRCGNIIYDTVYIHPNITPRKRTTKNPFRVTCKNCKRP